MNEEVFGRLNPSQCWHGSAVSVNSTWKVVTMLQKMQKSVEVEGENDKELCDCC